MGKVLIACEESQAVTIEMRRVGVEAYSCDIEPCSGGHPEWHLQTDVTELLKDQWDAIIAFPPCTHLCVSGARWFKQKQLDGRQQEGIDFFMMFAKANCKKIVIENPIGIMSTRWREPMQIVQPYQFGDEFTKPTCLWIKGLPLLVPTNIVGKGERVVYGSGKSQPKWYSNAYKLSPKERAMVRSRTFTGIAKAMADQWGKYILGEEYVNRQREV